MTDTKRVHFWLSAVLFGLWLVLIIGLLSWLLWRNNLDQGRHNRLWLAYYSNAVAVNLAQQRADEPDPEFLRLLNVPGLRQACVYIDHTLSIRMATTAPVALSKTPGFAQCERLFFVTGGWS